MIPKNEEPKAFVVESETGIKFYYPITTNVMCHQYYEKPTTYIKPKTLLTLKNYYPNHLATGYGINEVRDIWSITFDKNNE